MVLVAMANMATSHPYLKSYILQSRDVFPKVTYQMCSDLQQDVWSLTDCNGGHLDFDSDFGIIQGNSSKMTKNDEICQKIQLCNGVSPKPGRYLDSSHLTHVREEKSIQIQHITCRKTSHDCTMYYSTWKL